MYSNLILHSKYLGKYALWPHDCNRPESDKLFVMSDYSFSLIVSWGGTRTVRIADQSILNLLEAE